MAAAEIGAARARRGPGSAARLRLLAAAAILLIWELLGASGLVYPGVLPSWGSILVALAGLLASSDFWLELAATLAEIGLALLIGGSLGVLAGVALGLGGQAGRGLVRYVHYLASTPKVIFLPLALILFGIGSGSKIALGAFACSFPLVLGTAAAMGQIPPVLGLVARSFALSPWQMLRMVYLPAMAEPVLTGLRIALGIAVSACLVAEMRASTRGLGSMLIASYDHSRFADVYAILVIVIALAVAGNGILGRLARRRRHGAKGIAPDMTGEALG
jgi:NitT/TauT family transport system permease protein